MVALHHKEMVQLVTVEQKMKVGLMEMGGQKAFKLHLAVLKGMIDLEVRCQLVGMVSGTSQPHSVLVRNTTCQFLYIVSHKIVLN